MNVRTRILAGWLGLLAACAAQGQDGGLALTGFGTAGVVHFSGDPQLRRDDQPAPGDRRLDAGADSNLGLQLDWTATPRLGAAMQVLARRRSESDMEPRVESAFVRLRATEGLQLRLGRLVAPVYAQSDARWVGLSQPMLRPPQEVYGLAGVQWADGADLHWRHGGWELQALVGRSRLPGLMPSPEVQRLRGASVVWEPVAGLRLRAGRLLGVVVLGEGNRDTYGFDGVSAQLDRAAGFVSAEAVRRRSRINPLAVNADAWALSAGLRFRAWLPYAGVARTWGDAAAPLRMTPDQSTRTVGLRWDLDPALALKLQFDRVHTAAATPQATAGGPQPPAPARSGRALALALDFVF